MEKSEIVKEVHKILKEKKVVINEKESREIVNIVLDCISSNITKGKTVALSGFGNFYSKMREFRTPKTGEKVVRWQIMFKASRLLKNNINEKKI